MTRSGTQQVGRSGAGMMSWIERHMRSGPALATGVFLLGLCIAALSGMWLQRDIELDARAEFQRNVERVSNEVSRRFGQPVYGLNGARGMYAAMQRVNRAEFRAYVQARDLPREFPGVRGFGFIQRTMRNDLDGFIASERADGAPDFTIRQLEDRNLDELYVIKFIEPAASNSGAQGLDVGSEARRRQAARRAVDSGEPTLTAAITLVQDQRRTPGMLLYVPVFANPASVSSAQERRTSLVGLLYAPIVIAELLDGLHEVVGRRVDFELFDAVGGTHQSSLVYDADGHVAGLAADRDPMLGRRFHSTSTLSLPGRDMTLRVSGTPQFEAAFTSSTPWLVFAVGVLASALLAALLWQQASGRRRAEAMALAMTADLDRLAQVVKYTSNAVSITDRQLRITWVNEGFTRISGYTLEEARGRTPGELLGSNKASPAALRTLEHSATTGTGCRVEILNRGKDGSEYWIDTEVQPLRDARGELTGFMEIGSDITARRLAQAQLEAALRENEALLRTIDIHAIVSVADRAGRITDANEAFSRISGYSRAELLGQNHRIVNSGVQPRSFWDEMWRTISGGAPWRGEVCNRAKDGSLYWVDTLIAPFQGADGQIEKYVSIRTDITASKHAEAEVQRSATLLRGAIDTIDEAFVLYDPDDRLVFCNDKYRSIYATSADLIVPGATFEQIVREGARRGQYAAAVGRVEEWVAQRMAAHRAGNTTLVQQMDDGRSVRIVERRMPDGHIVGFRIDITELVRATEAAQEASRAKSRFVANMSHEIRTPMNAILGMLALLRKTGLTARQADYATKTEGAARSLLELLNDMLDFSKVEADQMTLELQPFPVDQLLRDLSDILTIGVGSKKLELLFDIDPALPPRLVGDAMRLRQVLVNLGSNAVKFTEAGEVVLSVAVLQRGEDAVTLRIEVRDTGIGIAPQDQPRIFNSFTQAEASTTRRFGGTGLGVAISGRLVTLMGGELELESGLGQGSRFHFCITLPIAPDPAGDAPSEPVPAAPWRVLVAEANPTTRAVLQRMCGSLGWMVDLADSTQQAFSLLRTQHPAGSAYQAVLLAWQLPGPDCRQISKRIRALGLAGAAPIMVMVSAHGRELLAPQVEGEPDPVDGFLVKPFTASMLLNAVVDARGLRERALDPPAAHADGEQRLSGMRLLVVEDNLNNQQVARELLESEGATVRIANHGQQAVEMVASTRPPFDIVLMDLQMPVMDGFTAASRIRTNLGLLALPIVAMTANAMASDREACLAAGMNDHIGKPIDLDHLVQVLRQHAGRPQTPVGPLGAGAPELPAPVRQAAAAAGVEIDVALNRLGANRDIYQRLLRAFVASLTVMPDRLRAHVAQGQLVPASHLLHALKGQAATLGAPMLARAAAQGETDLSGANAPGQASLAAQQACSAIAGACPALGALLQALQDCDPPGAAIATAVDTRALLTQLRTLAELLQNADMAATDSMHAMQRQFGAASGASLRPLDEAITALDFEHALRLCTRLMAQLIESQPG